VKAALLTLPIGYGILARIYAITSKIMEGCCKMKLKFGVRLPVSGPLADYAAIRKISETADALGFDAVTIHDHISTSYAARYHNAGGLAEQVDERDRAGLPVTNFYESIATLSVVAGWTQHVRLVPSTLVLPYRHAVLFAKQCATLSILSNGRLVCCIGIGSLESDFEVMNIPFREKGKIMDDYLEAIHSIFSPEKKITHAGKYIHFEDKEFYPKPKNMPIWIAGHFNPIVYGRIAKYGNGWITTGTPKDFAEGLATIRKVHLPKYGRQDNIEVGTQTFLTLADNLDAAQKIARYTIENYFNGKESDGRREAMVQKMFENALVGSPKEISRKLEEYQKTGVSFFDMRLIRGDLNGTLEMLRLFAREVMPSFS